MAIIRTKYQLMANSEVTDGEGNNYPDLATFPIEEFTPTTKPANYSLSWQNTKRFDLLIHEWYGSFPFYDDIILWLNDVVHISDSDTNFQRVLQMFSKQDLDDWYVQNVRSNRSS